MAKNIALTIDVDDSSVQELLSKLGQLQQQLSTVSKAQDGLASSNTQLTGTYKLMSKEVQVIYSRLGQLSKLAATSKTAVTDAAVAIDDGFKEAKRTINATAASFGEMQQITAELGANNLEAAFTGVEDQATSSTSVVDTLINKLKTALELAASVKQVISESVAVAEAPQTAQELDPTVVTNDTRQQGSGDPAGFVQRRLDLAQEKLGFMKSALGQIDAAAELSLQSDLNRIEEKRAAEIAAVNASLSSEEQKQAKLAQINNKYDKQTAEVQKKAKRREQAIAITTALINGALAITQAMAQFGPPPSPAGIAAIATAGVTTATQVAAIAAKQFKRGGYIPFKAGGTIQGPLHSKGGVPFMAGGQLMEAEGGELIVNRNIWSRPDFVRAISNMNASTGGRRFYASGGVVPQVGFNRPTGSSAAEIGEVSAELVEGMRGVIAEEVGSLKVVNNVVDTTNQQTALINQQVESSF